MTTLELMRRLVKRWNLTLGNLPVDVLQSLLDCTNAGLQDFYSDAPSIYRELPITAVLAAQQTINLTVMNGSSSFSGFMASANNYFATVRIPTDTTTDNMIIPPSGLMEPYQGVTGVQPAVLFGDVVPLPGNIERIIDEPALLGCRWRLQRNDEYWGRGWDFAGPYRGSGVARRVGVPRTYWIEPNALCLGGNPAFILRVDPLPASLYTLRMRALFYPPRLVSLPVSLGGQLNQVVPINDAWIESILIPLILEKMTEDPLWTAKNTDKIEKNADRARERIADLSPVMEKPNYRVETEPGW